MIRSSLLDAARRAYISISRGTLIKTDDKKKWPELTVRGEYGEKIDGVELVQPYGFSYHPHPPKDDKATETAEMLLIFPDGSRSHPIAIGVGDRRHRHQVEKEGETLVYDDQGQQIYVARDRIIIHSSKEVHVQRGKAHVLLSDSKTKMQFDDMSVTCKGGKVFLGKEDVLHKVMTEDGPSEKVFCVINESDSAMTEATAAKKVS